MRQSRAAKAATHQAIVSEAARLFRGRGIDHVSVGDVMHAAARTHGGFYRHFDSKQALLIAALEEAFDEMLGLLDHVFERARPAQALARFVASYLSPVMVDDVAGGCPVAALCGDVLRSDEEVRAVFGRGAQRIIGAIAKTLDGPEKERMRRAARAFAMASGALMIARASDPATAAMVLDAVRTGGAGEKPRG